MQRCPVCKSFRIVIVIAPLGSGRCDRCGAQWVQEGSEQRAIHAASSVERNISRISVHPTRQLDVRSEGWAR